MSSCGTWAYGLRALRRNFFKGSGPVFIRVLEKTTENSECLVRQARPGIDPNSSRQPVLRVEPFGHCRAKVIRDFMATSTQFCCISVNLFTFQFETADFILEVESVCLLMRRTYILKSVFN